MCFEEFFNVRSVKSRSALGLALGFLVDSIWSIKSMFNYLCSSYTCYGLKFKLQDGTWVHMCWCPAITVHTCVNLSTWEYLAMTTSEKVCREYGYLQVWKYKNISCAIYAMLKWLVSHTFHVITSFLILFCASVSEVGLHWDCWQGCWDEYAKFSGRSESTYWIYN